MNWWAIVLVICAIALAVGPVMMFQPSARDKRLAALRQTAAQKGLRVRLSSAEASPTGKPVAIYSRHLPEGATPNQWLLTRRLFSHEIHFDGHWEWDGNKVDGRLAAAPETDWVKLRAVIDGLPDYVVGIERTEQFVGVWWLERADRIEEVEKIFDQLVTLS